MLKDNKGIVALVILTILFLASGIVLSGKSLSILYTNDPTAGDFHLSVPGETSLSVKDETGIKFLYMKFNRDIPEPFPRVFIAGEEFRVTSDGYYLNIIDSTTRSGFDRRDKINEYCNEIFRAEANGGTDQECIVPIRFEGAAQQVGLRFEYTPADGFKDYKPIQNSKPYQSLVSTTPMPVLETQPTIQPDTTTPVEEKGSTLDALKNVVKDDFTESQTGKVTLSTQDETSTVPAVADPAEGHYSFKKIPKFVLIGFGIGVVAFIVGLLAPALAGILSYAILFGILLEFVGISLRFVGGFF